MLIRKWNCSRAQHRLEEGFGRGGGVLSEAESDGWARTFQKEKCQVGEDFTPQRAARLTWCCVGGDSKTAVFPFFLLLTTP